MSERSDYSEQGSSLSRYTIDLKHHRQRFNWDCGISCVLMVLPYDKRQFLLNNHQIICKEEGFSRSTWTIDLCYLLKRFTVDFVFYTTTLGIHPQHKAQHFYEKILQQDEERVTERFSKAAENGIRVEKRSLTIEELLDHVKDHGPVIVLSNACLLHCNKCKKNKLTTQLINCLPWVVGYHGHYVVVCGYDLESQQLFYRNPTYSNRVCVMDFASFDRARFFIGTDEDCICVFSNASASHTQVQCD